MIKEEKILVVGGSGYLGSRLAGKIREFKLPDAKVVGVDIGIGAPILEEDVLNFDDPCPECGTQLEAKWSGVECPNPDCSYWFCL